MIAWKTTINRVKIAGLTFLMMICLAGGIFVCDQTLSLAKKTATVKETEERETSKKKQIDGHRSTRDVRLHNKDNVMPAEYDREYFHVGDHGFLTFASVHAMADMNGAPSYVRQSMANLITVDEFKGTKIDYSVDKPDVLTIDQDKHLYRILKGGEATVIISAKVKVPDPTKLSGYTMERWLAKFTFIVMGDAGAAKFEKKKVVSYIVNDSVGSADVQLKDCPDLKYYSFDYASSNSDMCVKAELDPLNKKLHLESYIEGESTITVWLNGKKIKLKLENRQTGIDKTHHIMDVGDVSQLKIEKYHGKVKWKSTNKKVVTVDKEGNIIGKKPGNAVVYAKLEGLFEDQLVGCAVSVVKKGMTAVVEEGAKIGKNCLYSQPLRMSPGFYDCSSLVWMAYRLVGIDFGLDKYAPTAASECQWLAEQNKILGKWDREQIQKMVYRPGDLLFRVGADNGRYLGIYHVEMFAGYRVMGFDEDGEPILAMCWANRPDDYYDPCEDIMGRP